MTEYCVHRIIANKPGCVDFLGVQDAENITDAERLAEAAWGTEAGTHLEVHEENTATNEIEDDRPADDPPA